LFFQQKSGFLAEETMFDASWLMVIIDIRRRCGASLRQPDVEAAFEGSEDGQGRG
jgi:hypothetical protein